jgi:hypothetical protein
MRYNQLKVFQNGGMIEFRTLENVLITSEPKGSLRIRRTGIIGLSFEQLANGSVVAYVLNFADVLDSSGATYGNTFNEVLLALSAFFELEAAVTQAGNGLSLSGREVQLGGALKKDTTISGFFNFILSGLNIFRTSSKELEQTLTHTNGSIKKRTVAISVDVATTSAFTYFTLAMDANKQYAVEIFGKAQRNVQNGDGTFRVINGARRTTLPGGNTLSGTTNTIILESLAGAFTMSAALSGNNVIFTVTNTVATKTRFEAWIEILETSIPDNF